MCASTFAETLIEELADAVVRLQYALDEKNIRKAGRERVLIEKHVMATIVTRDRSALRKALSLIHVAIEKVASSTNKWKSPEPQHLLKRLYALRDFTAGIISLDRKGAAVEDAKSLQEIEHGESVVRILHEHVQMRSVDICKNLNMRMEVCRTVLQRLAKLKLVFSMGGSHRLTGQGTDLVRHLNGEM